MAPVIIVTGASRGIGLSIARFLLSSQARLVVVSRTEEPLQQLRHEFPDQVEVLAGDLSDAHFSPKAIDLADSRWGRIDGLVINHGVLAPVNPIAELDLDAAKSAFDTNFLSAVAIIKAALPALRKTKGRIIMTSSGAAISGYTGWGMYGASKAALNHLALTLATEETEVTTIAVRPGVVDTDMQREIREVHHGSMSKKDAEKFLGLKASGGLLKPEQPGNVMGRLVLEAPSELNGRFISWNDKELAAFQD